jgi:CD2 antigen cytoplasmic tail-binding protein 2
MIPTPPGPFSLQQLQGWRGTGFFGSPACENVELRLVTSVGQTGDWGLWAEVVGA